MPPNSKVKKPGIGLHKIPFVLNYELSLWKKRLVRRDDGLSQTGNVHCESKLCVKGFFLLRKEGSHHSVASQRTSRDTGPAPPLLLCPDVFAGPEAGAIVPSGQTAALPTSCLTPYLSNFLLTNGTRLM